MSQLKNFEELEFVLDVYPVCSHCKFNHQDACKAIVHNHEIIANNTPGAVSPRMLNHELSESYFVQVCDSCNKPFPVKVLIKAELTSYEFLKDEFMVGGINIRGISI
jgi:hypothetical protein